MQENSSFDDLELFHGAGERLAHIFRRWFERVSVDPNDFEPTATELEELREFAVDWNRGEYEPPEARRDQIVDYCEFMVEPFWSMTEVKDLLDLSESTLLNYRLTRQYRFVIHPNGTWHLPHSELLRMSNSYRPKYKQRRPDRNNRGFKTGKDSNPTNVEISGRPAHRQKQANSPQQQQDAVKEVT